MKGKMIFTDCTYDSSIIEQYFILCIRMRFFWWFCKKQQCERFEIRLMIAILRHFSLEAMTYIFFALYEGKVKLTTLYLYYL